MNKLFYMMYQPLFQHGKVVAVEALLRPYNHSQSIPEFINTYSDPLLLDQDVIKTVISDVKTYPFINEVHINIHPSSLKSYDFISLCITLRMTTSTKIVLEIIEYEYHQFDSMTCLYMRYLRTFGIQIAIDDFGQNFANSESLINIPVDKVKIDGSLVKGIEHKGAKLKLLSYINSMVVGLLDSLVVFEQVENIKQLELILLINPDAIIQGYYLEKPLKLEDLKVKYQHLFVAFNQHTNKDRNIDSEIIYNKIFQFISFKIDQKSSIKTNEFNHFVGTIDTNKMIYNDDINQTLLNFSKKYFKHHV